MSKSSSGPGQEAVNFQEPVQLFKTLEGNVWACDPNTPGNWTWVTPQVRHQVSEVDQKTAGTGCSVPMGVPPRPALDIGSQVQVQSTVPERPPPQGP